MLREGLADCARNIRPVFFELPSKERIELRVSQLTIIPPTVPHTAIGVRKKRIFPTECRQRAATYKGMKFLFFSLTYMHFLFFLIHLLTVDNKVHFLTLTFIGKRNNSDLWEKS